MSPIHAVGTKIDMLETANVLDTSDRETAQETDGVATSSLADRWCSFVDHQGWCKALYSWCTQPAIFPKPQEPASLARTSSMHSQKWTRRQRSCSSPVRTGPISSIEIQQSFSGTCFFRFPPEIRNMIYEQVFAEDAAELWSQALQQDERMSYSDPTLPTLPSSQFKPYSKHADLRKHGGYINIWTARLPKGSGLLATCQKVHAEIRSMYQSSLRPHSYFFVPRRWHPMSARMLDPYAYQHIRKLRMGGFRRNTTDTWTRYKNDTWSIVLPQAGFGLGEGKAAMWLHFCRVTGEENMVEVEVSRQKPEHPRSCLAEHRSPVPLGEQLRYLSTRGLPYHYMCDGRVVMGPGPCVAMSCFEDELVIVKGGMILQVISKLKCRFRTD